MEQKVKEAKIDISETTKKKEEKEIIKPLKPVTFIRKVSSRLLNLREEPNDDSRIISILPYGTELEVSNYDNDWYKTVTASGVEGYVMKEYVTE